MVRILFVCHGNICRSPLAEYYLRYLAEKEGLSEQIYVESAATHSDEIWAGHGSPVYPPVQKILSELGIDCSGKEARLMGSRDYNKFDLIIGMDAENAMYMKRLCMGDPENRCSLLMDYTDRPGDVADPWYTRDFGAAFTDVKEGCEGLLDTLKKEGRISAAKGS